MKDKLYKLMNWPKIEEVIFGITIFFSCTIKAI